MKFESKFGVGEIVIIGSNIQARRDRGTDYLGEVIAVIFEKESTGYLVDVQTPKGPQRGQYNESSLVGDPDFNQDTGEYTELGV